MDRTESEPKRHPKQNIWKRLRSNGPSKPLQPATATSDLSQAEAFPRYAYEPLTQPQQIRILLLLPGHGSEELRCILKTIRLQDRFLRPIPDYVALSYTWGDPADTKMIRCGEEYVRIPGNLFDALRQLRSPRLGRRLWSDSICINQEDLQERSKQVRMMRRIYALATWVIVWLGEHNDLSRKSCHLLDNLADYYCSEHYDDDNPLETGPDLEPEDWQSLIWFFERPWFCRAWIFQEAVMAHRVCFVVGDWVKDWRAVCIVNECLGTHRNPVTLGPVTGENMRNPFFMEKHRIENTAYYDRKRDTYDDLPPPLLFLVIRSRERKATDPRDKIFAVLGLSQERETSPVVVDYASRVEQVYRDFALYELFERKSLDILGAAAPVGNLDLPSWVPDWTVPLEEEDVLATICRLELVLDGAGGDPENSDIKPIISLSDDGCVLSIRGSIVAGIRNLGMPKFSNEEIWRANDGYASVTAAPCRLKASFLAETFHMASHAPDPYHQTGQSRLEAYLRALIMNTVGHPSTQDVQPETVIPHGLKVLEKYGVEHGQPVSQVADLSWIKFETALNWNVRRFCLSTSGFFGWAPQGTELTDLICMFVGARMLFVLRAVDGGRYRLVGECYLHGLMDGELLEDEREYQDFLLV